MTFIVTARKWRPQLFSDVVGQQHISTTLKNAIENNRISHAYIFAGPRGVGKTTTARILAKRLNCENPNGGEPCNECSSCQNFLKSQSLDIIEIDGASNRRIDEIRTLRESVKYAPTSGNYKVYIIDEVHMLTTESFNALLKTLEEPPEHTIFIFATTDIHKVPLTIISRCQRFDFRRIELAEIKSLLKKIANAENIEIDDESLTLIAKKADGALRDAQSIFDQVVSFCGNKVSVSVIKSMLNLIDDEIYFDISNAILEKDFKVTYEVTEKIYSNGWNFIDFIDGLLEHFRNISSLLITNSTDYIETSESQKIKYEEYVDKFSKGDILRILSYLSKMQSEIKISQNQKLKVEIGLAHLIGFEKSSTISELLSNFNSAPIQEIKKKTKIINTTPPVEEKKNFVIPKFDIKKDETPVPKSNKKNNTSVKNEEKKDVKVETTCNNIEDIKTNWNYFKDSITKKRFTLGPLLAHTIPVSISNNTLIIDVTQKEDVSILTESIDFLSNNLNDLLSTKLKIKFSYNKNASIDSSTEVEKLQEPSEDEYLDHPLINSIITELGGTQIK